MSLLRQPTAYLIAALRHSIESVRGISLAYCPLATLAIGVISAPLKKI
jgi:hypothetical protein